MSDNTEITQSISSENPADNGTLEGLNDFLQDKMYLHLEKVIPGIVQSYDKATNRATIKPAITGIATQGAKVPKDVLNNIPVLQLGGGDVTMTFPIKAGMTGWLIASDRDISIFKSIKSETAPNTPRKHKYQDSFFIPDAINATGSDDFQIKAENSSFNLGKNSISEETQNHTITADSLQLNVPATTSTGTITATNLNATAAYSGTFKTEDIHTVTVVNGIITAIT